MKTELELVEAKAVAGRKIKSLEYSIRNYRLHQVVEQLSRLFLFCVECDSNNTSSKATPRDIKNIRGQWNNVKLEMDFSMANNGKPTGSHEYAFKVNLLDQKEIQQVRNVKMKRIVSEMFNAARVMLSVDSANSQSFIDEGDAADIREMFVVVDLCFDQWIGNGADASDTGIKAPAYEILGEVTPDVDSDFAQLLEPSSAMPSPKLPDTPDTL